jgi:hypothetical protein
MHHPRSARVSYQSNRRELGGRCWIGDSCYILPDDVKLNPGRDWDAFCKVFGIGVCVSTGQGEGGYPASVTIKDGRVTVVTVQFEPDHDDD